MSAIHENTEKRDPTELEQDKSHAAVPAEGADQDEVGSPNDPVSDPKKPSSEA